MMKSLDEKGFDKDNPQHVLISLGDLLDRGPDAVKCLEFVNSLSRKILIRGNHEDLMCDAIKRKHFYSHDYHNKTVETVHQLLDIHTDIVQQRMGYPNSRDILTQMETNKLWNTYINSCIDFAETDKYVFVHGWIPNDDDWRNGDWESARWFNGMEYWSYSVTVPDKTILCGHFHTSWGHSHLHKDGVEFDDEALCSFFPTLRRQAKFTPFKDKGIIALDACTALTGFCNCITLNIAEKQLRKYLHD